MTQSDLNVANASGATVRADINVHLDTLATQSAGATAPSTTFPNQWWLDTATNILKQRDNANTIFVSAFQKITTGWIPFREGVLLGDAAVQTIGVGAVANVANIEDLQQAAFAAILATGTADTITLDYTPVIASLNTFQPFTFEAASNNTGSVTINVDGLGAKTAKKNGGADDLVADDFVAGGLYTAIYDGTVMHIIAGLDGPTIVQVVFTQRGIHDNGTTIFPKDNTVPVNTEGNEYMIRTITPKANGNTLKIDVVIFLSGSQSTNQAFGVGLFQDSISAALATGASAESSATINVMQCITFTHYIVGSLGTSPITFKVRAGASISGTTFFNGNSPGIYGGTMASSITITELRA